MKTGTLEANQLNQYAVRVATSKQLGQLAKMERMGWSVYKIQGLTPHISCNPYVDEGDAEIFLSSKNNPQKKLLSAKLLQDGQLVRL